MLTKRDLVLRFELDLAHGAYLQLIRKLDVVAGATPLSAAYAAVEAAVGSADDDATSSSSVVGYSTTELGSGELNDTSIGYVCTLRDQPILCDLASSAASTAAAYCS